MPGSTVSTSPDRGGRRRFGYASNRSTINDERRWSLECAAIVRDALRRAEFVPSSTTSPSAPRWLPAIRSGHRPTGPVRSPSSDGSPRPSRGIGYCCRARNRRSRQSSCASPEHRWRQRPRSSSSTRDCAPSTAQAKRQSTRPWAVASSTGDWQSSTVIGEPDDEDEADDDGTGTLDFEAGHGTFIAGS